MTSYRLPSITRRSLLAGVIASPLVRIPRSLASAKSAPPRRPFPQPAAYAAGALTPTTRPKAELDDDVRAAYDHWKANFLVETGENDAGQSLMRVAFGNPGTPNHDITVSEGQGYGMVIVALMAGYDPDAKNEFDGLWRFARAYPSGIDSRLMGWHIPLDEGGNDSAFDGDSDIAYGLLLADAQWGSEGEIDYHSAALEVLGGMMDSTIGSDSRYPLLGDWVDPSGDQYNQWTTRPSDFMIGHFHAFARVTGDPTWDEVADACQSVIRAIQRNDSPETGLLPDFVQPVSDLDTSPRPADPGFLEGVNDGAYGYNAGRAPWRIGTDALINASEISRLHVLKMSQWSRQSTGGQPLKIRSGYQLDGTPSANSDYFTTFFAAPLAVAAMCDPDAQEWLDALYETVRDRREDYYEDSVILLCMLTVTGSFWDPTL